MSHSVVLSRAGIGLKAPLVKVEAHLSTGLPAFSVVGLPESSVRESRERVRSALICSHFKWISIENGNARFDSRTNNQRFT